MASLTSNRGGWPHVPFGCEFLFFCSQDGVVLRLLGLHQQPHPRIFEVDLSGDPVLATYLDDSSPLAPMAIGAGAQSLPPDRIYYPDAVRNASLRYGAGGALANLLGEIQTEMGSRLYYVKLYRRWRGKLPGPYFYYTRELFEQIRERVMAAPEVMHMLSAFPDSQGEKEIPLPYVYDPQYGNLPENMAWYHPLQLEVIPYPETANTTVSCELAPRIVTNYEVRSGTTAQFFISRIQKEIPLSGDNHGLVLYQQQQRLLPEQPLPNGAVLRVEKQPLPVVWGLEEIIASDMEYQAQLCCDLFCYNGFPCQRLPRTPPSLPGNCMVLGYDPWRRGFYISTKGSGSPGYYQMTAANTMVSIPLEKIIRALSHENAVVAGINQQLQTNTGPLSYYVYPPSLASDFQAKARPMLLVLMPDQATPATAGKATSQALPHPDPKREQGDNGILELLVQQGNDVAPKRINVCAAIQVKEMLVTLLEDGVLSLTNDQDSGWELYNQRTQKLLKAEQAIGEQCQDGDMLIAYPKTMV